MASPELALDEAAPQGAEPQWAEAVVEGLAPASPATDVTLTARAVAVDNRALIATWPAPDLARARAAPPAGEASWPEVRAELPLSEGEGLTIPGLQAALTRARVAERAATGRGEGAGAFHLHVALDVPFAEIERVLYGAALAGYAAPQLILRSPDGVELAMPWPRGGPRQGPTEAELRALLAGTAADAPPPPPRRDPRVRLGSSAIDVFVGEVRQAPRCEVDAAPDLALSYLPDAPAEALAACLVQLRPRAEGDTLTIAVAPELPFARLAPLLQHAARIFPALRVVRASPAT